MLRDPTSSLAFSLVLIAVVMAVVGWQNRGKPHAGYAVLVCGGLALSFVLLTTWDVPIILSCAVPLVAGAAAFVGYSLWEQRRLIRANRLLAAGRFDEAEALLRAELERLGPRWNTSMSLSTILINAGRYDEALRVLEEAETADPERWELVYNRSTVYLRTNRYDDALLALQPVLVRQPDNVAVVGQYGIVLARQGRRAEAQDQLRRAEGLLQSRRGAATRHYAPLVDELRRELGEAK